MNVTRGSVQLSEQASIELMRSHVLKASWGIIALAALGSLGLLWLRMRYGAIQSLQRRCSHETATILHTAAECEREAESLRKRIQKLSSLLGAYQELAPLLEDLESCEQDHQGLSREIRHSRKQFADLQRDDLQAIQRSAELALKEEKLKQSLRTRDQAYQAKLREQSHQHWNEHQIRVLMAQKTLVGLEKDTRQRIAQIRNLESELQRSQSLLAYYQRLDGTVRAPCMRPEHLQKLLQVLGIHGANPTLIPELRGELREAGLQVELRLPPLSALSELQLTATHKSKFKHEIRKAPSGVDLGRILTWWKVLKKEHPELLTEAIGDPFERQQRIAGLDRLLQGLVLGTDARIARRPAALALGQQVCGLFVAHHEALLSDKSQRPEAWRHLAQALLFCFADAIDGCDDRVVRMYRELYFRYTGAGAESHDSLEANVCRFLQNWRQGILQAAVDKLAANLTLDFHTVNGVNHVRDAGSTADALLAAILRDAALSTLFGLSSETALVAGPGQFARVFRQGLPREIVGTLRSYFEDHYSAGEVLSKLYQEQPFTIEQARQHLISEHGHEADIYRMDDDRSLLSLCEVRLLYSDERPAEALCWDGSEASWPAVAQLLDDEEIHTVKPCRFTRRGIAVLLQSFVFKAFI